jgi:hypothetical protein
VHTLNAGGGCAAGYGVSRAQVQHAGQKIAVGEVRYLDFAPELGSGRRLSVVQRRIVCAGSRTYTEKAAHPNDLDQVADGEDRLAEDPGPHLKREGRSHGSSRDV